MADPVAARQKTRVGTPAELAAARDARGMSQIDISQRIKLQIKQVNALEQGQWEALPGRSFVRGALRSYGRLLDVDVAPLLESIGGFAEPAPVHSLKPLDASLSRASGFDHGGGRGSPLPWVLAGLVGVVALVLYFGSDPDSERLRTWLPSTNPPVGESSGPGLAETGLDRAPPGGSAAPEPLTSTGRTATASEAAGGSPSAAWPEASLAGTPDAGAPAAANGSAASLSSTGQEPPEQLAAADNSKVLQFKAKEDSWIEVRQADGTALHNALLKAGSSIELKGLPPYRLVLGNAPGLEVSYEGKAQDLAPHLRPNNVARLQLQ